MKKLIIYSLFPIFLFTACIEEPLPDNAPQTVASVNLDEYLGLWYEIASYPQFFNIGCNCTTAEYELRTDGKVKVTNKCNLINENGPVSKVNGTAVPVPESNFTKLTVSFLGNNMGSENGNYWILELADDYSYAVVSDPFRSTWFLLSRTPDFDEELYNEIIDRAVDDGFIRNKIERTNQACS